MVSPVVQIEKIENYEFYEICEKVAHALWTFVIGLAFPDAFESDLCGRSLFLAWYCDDHFFVYT